MAQQFKRGDQVVLKSGGPTMTIDEIVTDGVWTVWFAGPKRERAHFHAESLDPAPPKSEPKK
jgi:uncharacterized protein YodC (DUF2158 family)